MATDLMWWGEGEEGEKYNIMPRLCVGLHERLEREMSTDVVTVQGEEGLGGN